MTFRKTTPSEQHQEITEILHTSVKFRSTFWLPDSVRLRLSHFSKWKWTHWRATACHLNLRVTWWLNVPSESFSQALSKWFHFRMPLCGMSICAHVCACRVVRDSSPRLLPQLMASLLWNGGRNGCLGIIQDIRKDQRQNQIKCHLDCSERNDCLTGPWKTDLLVTFSAPDPFSVPQSIFLTTSCWKAG